METENVPLKIAEFTAESGYKAMTELLEEHPDLDAVMCATDIIAHGAMKALKERGKRIPDDVSIAGVGDNWADLVSDPALSTVKLQQRQCGIEAARMLLKLIDIKSGEAEESVAKYLKENTEKASVKSKSAQKGSIELTYEVMLKNGDTDFITRLSEMNGVSSAVLVSYNGDYMG